MNGALRRRILYFEPDLSGGHKVVYMNHLAQYMLGEPGDVRVIFATGHSGELARLPWWKDARSGAYPNVGVVTLSDSQVAVCRSGPLVRRGIAQAQIATKIGRSIQASFVVFGWIDQALAGIAARQIALPCAGILFRTPEELPGFTTRHWPSQLISRGGKLALCKLALSNPRLSCIFALDSGFVRHFTRSNVYSGRVRYLADPFVGTHSTAYDPPDGVGRDFKAEGRRVYLAIGGIDPRKGILQCLTALTSLSSTDASLVALLIAGRVSPDFRSELLSSIGRAIQSNPNLRIELHDRLLSDSEYHWLLSGCDVVLVTYQNAHLGSSGTLVQAAAAGKPVIGTRDGLVGQEIKEFGLGITIIPTSSKSIADAFKTDLSQHLKISGDGRTRFLQGRNPREFARALLAGAIDSMDDSPQKGLDNGKCGGAGSL